MHYMVRWADKTDWTPAVKMIWRTFLAAEGKTASPEAIRNFFELLTADALYEAFLKGTYPMVIAADGDKIIGAGTLRSGNVISLLFVDEAYQHQGVGRALLSCLCERAVLHKQTTLRVKALPSAEPFYHKSGFEVTGPRMEYRGILVTEMQKQLK